MTIQLDYQEQVSAFLKFALAGAIVLCICAAVVGLCWLTFELKKQREPRRLTFGALYGRSLLAAAIAQVSSMVLSALVLVLFDVDLHMQAAAGEAWKLLMEGNLLRVGTAFISVCITYVVLHSITLRRCMPARVLGKYGLVFSFLAGGSLVFALDAAYLLLG